MAVFVGIGTSGELAIIGGWTVTNFFVACDIIWIEMFPWGADAGPLLPLLGLVTWSPPPLLGHVSVTGINTRTC
jgi:hypothetical protein